ncbi:MAG: acyl dehydratase [Dehalococcoidia bacterium]|nr:acyl dehydratase [Dehalococcoidia bacterium]
MALKASALKAGATHQADLVKDLKRTQIVQYAGASGDYNPIHTDEPFATHVAGFPTVIAHGMLTMGITGKAVTDYVGDGRLKKYGVRFLATVVPGDDLKASLTVKEVRDEDGEKVAEFDVVTTNQDGVEVLRGYATARVD